MIQTLRLHNYKIFEDTPEIELGKMTLLTGTNGRGKSSFIQPLILLAQSMNESEDKSPLNLIPSGSMLELGEFEDILNRRAIDGNISFAFKTDAKHDADYKLTYKQSSKKEYGEMTSMIVDGVETFSKNTGFNVKDDSNVEVAPPTFSGYTPLMNLRRLFYVAADRIAPIEQNFAISSSSINSHGFNVLKVIYFQDVEFREQLEKLMSNILDGATLSIKATADSYILQMDSCDNGSLFKSTNVGYGYSYILLLLSSVMLAQEGDLVIIENPEAHLHPSAQARLMKYLISVSSEKDVQIIVETHSDHIVNGALVGVHNKEIDKSDLGIVFFDSNSKNNHSDLIIKKLDITSQGTVSNPPKNFCDQYAIDLKTLMGF